MNATELHQHLSEISSAFLSAKSPANDARDVEGAGAATSLAAFEAHASEGCSPCARALVNAGDTFVDLAATVAVAPPSALRDRVLSKVKRSASAGQRVSVVSSPRIEAPAAAVAHMHIGAPGDAERIAEIDALDALTPRPGERTSAMLSELHSLLEFSVFFVSIIRGERVAYRVQHGLPPELAIFRELRREMSYCTHCVSAGGPLLVEDASREAFFRTAKMLQLFGVHAYAGVPLATARRVVVGTLCGLNFGPRRIVDGDVGILEHYTTVVRAEIEAERQPSLRAELFEEIGVHRIYRRGWFEELARIVAAAHKPISLVHVTGPGAERAVELAEEGEPIGRTALGLGLLVRSSNVEAALARLRAAGLDARLEG
jgi:hypothetical protein